MISQVKFASIPVSDQARALEFYTRKLGFEVLTDAAFGNGQRWIELTPPGAQTRVVLFTPPGHEDRIGTFSNIAFATADVEATYRTLKERGVEFAVPPTREPWGTYAQFKDPDGNLFLLSSV